jgi:excisionase family DNA binding protein
MADQLVDVKTLEGLTQLPRSWLYAKAAAGEIPHVKVGKYIRFHVGEVFAWLERHRRGSVSAAVKTGE